MLQVKFTLKCDLNCFLNVKNQNGGQATIFPDLQLSSDSFLKSSLIVIIQIVDAF